MDSGGDEIDDATCRHFQQVFIGKDKLIKEEMLNCIPSIVTQEQNEVL